MEDRKAILARRARFLSAALAGIGLAGTGCSEQPTAVGGQGGTGTTTGDGATSAGAGGTGTGAATCLSSIPTTSSTTASTLCPEQLDNTADVVELEMVAQDPPAPAGGDIVPGTYHLVELVQYVGPNGFAGPTGELYQTTSVWAAAEAHFVVKHEPYPEDDVAATYSVDGVGQLSIEWLCPITDSEVYGYTATAGTITLYAYDPSSWGFVYSLQ